MKTHAELKRLALLSPAVREAYEALEEKYAEIRVRCAGSPDMQVELALMLLRDGRIGLVQAADIVGVSPSEMMDICADHHVSLIGYPAEELAEEIGKFQNQA